LEGPSCSVVVVSASGLRTCSSWNRTFAYHGPDGGDAGVSEERTLVDDDGTAALALYTFTRSGKSAVNDEGW